MSHPAVDPAKDAAARAAVALVESGMKLGLGTGSTAKVFVDRLAERVHGGEFSHVVISPGPGTPEREEDFGAARGIIAAAAAAGVTLYLTGTRHFAH